MRPNRSSISTLRRVAATAVAVALATVSPSLGGERDEAIRLYDAGSYDEARTLIERLDEAGEADGTLLYRLAFCELRAGERDAARATMERALERLEPLAASATEIEIPFYLANTYQNLGRGGELARHATATVARVERGEIEIDDGVDEFRVAKLYADLGRTERAADWYGRALDSFRGRESEHAAYVSWARDWLSNRTSDAAPARPAAPATAAGRLDEQAVEHARAGRWAEAAAAWREAMTKRPADPNRTRYCGALAATAATLAPMPETAPDGRAWSALGKDDLQAILVEQAAVVRGARRLAAALDGLPRTAADGERWSRLDDDALRAQLVAWGAPDADVPQVDEGSKPIKAKRAEALRARLAAQIDRARPVFVTAGLWFGIGRHGLREVAFFGGFAPLIFREPEWTLDGR